MSQQPVTITDVDIPFGRMVVIIFKFMLASIPAVILFYLFMAFFMLVFGGMFAGMIAAFSQ